ncbi:MAG: MarR family winged helix-turn-helix transcriptional regulator [Candidatus Saccharimonadales bacterium]
MDSDVYSKLDSALLAVMRVAKKPLYWDDFQRKAGAQIDRPSAAILMLLGMRNLQFRELVAKLGIEAPSISRKVHELEQDGLVAREQTVDRRVHVLSLTTEGRKLSERIIDARKAMLKEVLVGWSGSEKRLLSEQLVRLASDLATRYGTKEATKI